MRERRERTISTPEDPYKTAEQLLAEFHGIFQSSDTIKNAVFESWMQGELPTFRTAAYTYTMLEWEPKSGEGSLHAGKADIKRDRIVRRRGLPAEERLVLNTGPRSPDRVFGRGIWYSDYNVSDILPFPERLRKAQEFLADIKTLSNKLKS